MRIHPHWEILFIFIEFRVCSSLLQCDLQEISMNLIMVLVDSSTELVLRKSSFIILNVYDASWRLPTDEPIASPIKWKTHWYTGWSYVSWDTRLFADNAFMITQPVGGCHSMLLGCDLNPLFLWSKRGPVYWSSFVCWYWHGHPGLFGTASILSVCGLNLRPKLRCWHFDQTPQKTDICCRHRHVTNMSVTCRRHHAKMCRHGCRHDTTIMSACSAPCQQMLAKKLLWSLFFRLNQHTTIKYCAWRHFGRCVERPLKVAAAAFGDVGSAKCNRMWWRDETHCNDEI